MFLRRTNLSSKAGSRVSPHRHHRDVIVLPRTTPPLLEGDSLDADEFIRRWEQLPNIRRAELIDGTVYSFSRTVAQPDALWSRDLQRLNVTLQQGMATLEHAAFVAELAARKA